MANDDENFNQDIKWQLEEACYALSKQENWSCIVG